MIFPLWFQATLQFLCVFLASLAAFGDVLAHPWDKITTAFVSALQMMLGLYGHTRRTDGGPIDADPDGRD